jgi:hypothetical protein
MDNYKVIHDAKVSRDEFGNPSIHINSIRLTQIDYDASMEHKDIDPKIAKDALTNELAKIIMKNGHFHKVEHINGYASYEVSISVLTEEEKAAYIKQIKNLNQRISILDLMLTTYQDETLYGAIKRIIKKKFN